MPGPKMGPRPPDFDEEVIRQSPTFLKWLQLEPGQKLRYACREFIRGHNEDEERLMRRVMIARRNNIRDHETLKKARGQTKGGGGEKDQDSNSRKRRPATVFSDEQVEKEMDVPAVLATRSYCTWQQLPDGAEFVYNQKYVKGKDGHDWLLRKNIWRRMRYRRENKRMVQRMRKTAGGTQEQNVAGDIVDQALMPEEQQQEAAAASSARKAVKTEDEAEPKRRRRGDAAVAAAAAAANSDQLADQAAVEAAVAAAESFGKTNGLDMSVVQNPLEAAAARAALDAAAKLAAATAGQSVETNDSDAAVEGLLKDEIDQTADV